MNSVFFVNNIPTHNPEDWKNALPSKRAHHWKKGYSMWALANSWEASRGFPPEVLNCLRPVFPEIQFERGLVEYEVPMPAGREGSHTDVMVLANSDGDKLWIAVEGKASESLGQPVGEWLEAPPSRKEERLMQILPIIGLNDVPSTIFYQLLHRMASPIIEARRFGSQHAVMLVHSFSGVDQWFDDFAAFVHLYGPAEVQADTLYPLMTTVDNIRTYAAWVRGDPKFLGI